jgi:hypothetical protein
MIGDDRLGVSVRFRPGEDEFLTFGHDKWPMVVLAFPQPFPANYTARCVLAPTMNLCEKSCRYSVTVGYDAVAMVTLTFMTSKQRGHW